MPTYQPVKRIPFNENEFPPEDNRPVCLFVGMFNASFDSTFMVKGFENEGYRVEVLDWQKVKYEATGFRNEVVLNEVTNEYEEKKVMENGTAILQETLLKKAAFCNPSLIFLHIQSTGILNTIIVSQLEAIAPTVAYNFDCRTHEDTGWIYDLAPYVSLICFSNLEDVMACRKRGNYNTMVLQSSADYEVYRPLLNKENISKEFNHEIVFIGNKSEGTNLNFPEAKRRTELVEFLQKEYGDRFKAWGMGWNYSRIVNRQEEVMIYNACKIAITQNNFSRADYQSDRAYRAMGCGALTILQFFPNVNKYFTKEVAGAWLDFDMLKSEIDRYLADEETRLKKAANGAMWVRAKHSWENRVQELKIALKNVKKDAIWT